MPRNNPLKSRSTDSLISEHVVACNTPSEHHRVKMYSLVQLHEEIVRRIPDYDERLAAIRRIEETLRFIDS